MRPPSRRPWPPLGGGGVAARRGVDPQHAWVGQGTRRGLRPLRARVTVGPGLPYGIHAARPSAAACGVSVKPLTVVCSGGLRPSCPAAGKPEARAEGICVAPPETDPHSLGSRLGLHGIGHPPPPASAFSSGISLGLPGTGRGPPLALAFSSGMRHGHDVQRPPLQRWLSRAGGVWSAGLLRPSRPEFPGQTVGFARRSSRMHTGRARLRQVFAPRSGAPPCVASLSSP
jgi:hypothetical protein